MLATLSFGKHRRRSTKKSTKKVRKPPARLLKLCKKYRVKSSKRVGKHRVYKSISVLKRQCLKKAMALKKKLMKMHKKSKKTTRRRKTHRRGDEFGEETMFGSRRRARKTHAFGNDEELVIPDDMPMTEDPMSSFGRYPQFGSSCSMKPVQFGRSRFGNCVYGVDKSTGKKCNFGYSRFGNPVKDMVAGTLANGADIMGNAASKIAAFGKRRRAPKVSKAAAMKAFRTFYKRHCAVNRRSRFGSSNPPLVNSMGYEFCSDGVGGVLGSNSTGLFPSPCVSASSSGFDRATTGDVKAAYKAAGGFGRRRRTTRKKPAAKPKGTKSKSKSSAFGSRRKTRKTHV